MRRLVILALALAGCASERTRPGASALVTWEDDVAPVVADRCVDCHGGAAPAGAYDLTSYLGALGAGSDGEANAIAGDAGSRILTALDDDTHADVRDTRDLLRAWVVDSRLAYFDTPLHAPDFLDPSSDGFHGKELERRGWDFALCATCHGEQFDGGTAQRSCKTCHQDGPTGCTTCHGEPPPTGAHVAHIDHAVGCPECHVTPTAWDEPGHLLQDSTPDAVEITFGAKAGLDLVPPRRDGPPTYVAATQTCHNIYCPGGAFGDAAATHPAPSWGDGPDDVACGGCHGVSPSDHAGNPGPSTCTVCHPSAAPHIDGTLDIGDGQGTCASCHGDATSPAPPRGLHGETSPLELAVGAHRAHLEAPSHLAAPIPCDRCHAVPATTTATGHLDGDLIAEVFPEGDDTWNATTGTCTTYCHGAQTPLWTDANGAAAACGSCHGIPPNNPYHDQSLTLGDCTTCHTSIDAFGVLNTEHINGQIDLR